MSQSAIAIDAPVGTLTRAPETRLPAKGNKTHLGATLSATNADVFASNSFLALNGALAAGDVLSRPQPGLAEAKLTFEHPALGFSKRAFDVVFAAAVLIMLLPILVVCGLAVAIESRGPIFFKQKRIGHKGSPFSIVKFRTMVPNAEAVLAEYLEKNLEAKREWAADRKLRNDPRVTRIGRLMRRFSVDELPQFWNVLKGDMSVVGPRPIVNAEVPFYGEDFRAYCHVRPGITGLWQVSGRNDTGYPYRVALDSQYVNDWTSKLDATIILRTFKTVVSAAGAY